MRVETDVIYVVLLNKLNAHSTDAAGIWIISRDEDIASRRL